MTTQRREKETQQRGRVWELCGVKVCARLGTSRDVLPRRSSAVHGCSSGPGAPPRPYPALPASSWVPSGKSRASGHPHPPVKRVGPKRAPRTGPSEGERAQRPVISISITNRARAGSQGRSQQTEYCHLESETTVRPDGLFSPLFPRWPRLAEGFQHGQRCSEADQPRGAQAGNTALQQGTDLPQPGAAAASPSIT